MTIGTAQIDEALADQTQLYQRLSARYDAETMEGAHGALVEHAANMGVDYDQLETSIRDYIAEQPYVAMFPDLLAIRWFLLGVILGRDHKP